MVLGFMDNNKNDHYYLEKIKKDIAFIVIHMKDVDLQALNEDEVLLDSMLFRMIQISENAKKLSAEYKKENSSLPWDELSGLRNRIVHDYGNVDLKIVYETLKYDIPDLMEQFKDDRYAIKEMVLERPKLFDYTIENAETMVFARELSY